VSFELLSPISSIESIAVGHGIRDLARIQRLYGRGKWRKLKGVALIREDDGEIYRAEIHWYEASGIGRREFKVKDYLW
jgi:hypothetical protein